MDTMELMNEETMDAVVETANTAISAISEAAANVAPEIRYVEVPVEGSGSIGSFFCGILAAGLTAVGVAGGRYVWKKHKAKKDAKTVTEAAGSGSIEGYERKVEEPKAEEQKAAEPETVKGEVVDEKKPEKK